MTHRDGRKLWPKSKAKDDRAREEAQKRFEAILHHMSSEGLRQFDALHVLDVWHEEWAAPIVAYVVEELEHAKRLVETGTKPRHRPRLPTTNQTLAEFYTTQPRSNSVIRQEAISVVNKALGYDVPSLESSEPKKLSTATKLRKKLKRRGKPLAESSSGDRVFKRRKGRKKLEDHCMSSAGPPAAPSEPPPPEPNWQVIHDDTGALGAGPHTAEDKWR